MSRYAKDTARQRCLQKTYEFRLLRFLLRCRRLVSQLRPCHSTSPRGSISSAGIAICQVQPFLVRRQFGGPWGARARFPCHRLGRFGSGIFILRNSEKRRPTARAGFKTMQEKKKNGNEAETMYIPAHSTPFHRACETKSRVKMDIFSKTKHLHPVCANAENGSRAVISCTRLDVRLR